MKSRGWSFTDTLCFDLEAEVDFKGSFTPGRVNGDPDDCYPDELEDEREVLDVTIGGKALPEKLRLALIDWLYTSELIQDAEMPEPPGREDYDDRDD